MTEQIIYIEKYDTNGIKPVHDAEVWRYAGYKGIPSQDETELLDLFKKVKAETLPVLSYKVCYQRMELSWDGDRPALPFGQESKDFGSKGFVSKDLAKCIRGCHQIVLFAATIGMGIDRLILRNQRTEITKALLMQALGAERIEALCDTFCEKLAEEFGKDGLIMTPRFSPGYGDLPLDTQKDFFRLLDCNRKIGIALNDSLLMTPSKSVTAIFGIRKLCPEERVNGVKNKNKMENGSRMENKNEMENKSGMEIRNIEEISENKCDRCNNTACEFRQQEERKK